MILKRLGTCVIQSLNQIGEKVKYVQKANGFVLSKRGSPFTLFSYRDNENDLLEDFREAQGVLVVLEVNGKYLSVEPESGNASTIEIADDAEFPRTAIFRYVKQKFDALSVSICTTNHGQDRWLRHTNSKLRVRY